MTLLKLAVSVSCCSIVAIHLLQQMTASAVLVSAETAWQSWLSAWLMLKLLNPGATHVWCVHQPADEPCPINWASALAYNSVLAFTKLMTDSAATGLCLH